MPRIPLTKSLAAYGCMMWLIATALLPAHAAPKNVGNRLIYLDHQAEPYWVGLHMPRLTTPQWIGEDGIEAVILLSIDDMRNVDKYENYLRPILERLKQIDGRVPLSIFTNQIDPKHQHLQTWLAEGLSFETHTIDHPCPLLQHQDFSAALSTYNRCVDLLAKIPSPENRKETGRTSKARAGAVAFRMPCCDSINSVSPRFFAEIFNRTTANGHFLSIDSSVFNFTTDADKSLARDLVTDAKGRPRFEKYLPAGRDFVNTIQNYPYPYVIGRLCWEFPGMAPSDWEAQDLQGKNNPDTVADMKKAVDVAVAKRGQYTLVFHPHGWIRNTQIVELIDYAVKTYGKKIKFLSFAEADEHLETNLLGGHRLRAANGQDNGVRILDVNHDGYMDVVIGNEKLQQTRIWDPKADQWRQSDFPVRIVHIDSQQEMLDAGVRFGVLQKSGQASLIVNNDREAGIWHFKKDRWQYDEDGLAGLLLNDEPVFTANKGVDRGVRLVDIDGDGFCELIVGNHKQGAVFGWKKKKHGWKKLPYGLPKGVTFVDEQGRDAGLRFQDVNGDDRPDILFSNQERYGLWQYDSPRTGWSDQAFAAARGSEGFDAIPPFVAADKTNNGVWFMQGRMWIQNENTGNRLKNHVAQRELESLAKGATMADSAKPKSPSEAIKTMTLGAGMKIELVAAEPLVVDPVAFDWGPDGRLWVAQMHDYPNGLDGRGKPGGSIKVLQDTDGDGRYDKATLFLDGIGFPSGIKVWRKGILISAAPHIIYAEDTNGDNKADIQKKLFSGFIQGNQQHRVNGFRWRLDNGLQIANGDSGGKITSSKTGKSINISGRDLRINPDTGALEGQTGQTQSGTNRDDWGNWFGGNNSNPMWHYALADPYLRRNPHMTSPDPRKHVPIQPGTARVFPTSQTLERFNDFDKANRFTSACSPMIYRDIFLGTALAGNSFVCEPVHNLIHREIVSAQGVSFTSRRAANEAESEFLSSSDSWFRPVQVRTGPDGAIWIADMYRYVIEHPKWIPKQWQARLNLRAGADRGRIWRIVPVDATPRPIVKLDQFKTPDLVTALDSPNGTQRDLAHQMLLWRADKAAAGPLIKLVTHSKHAQAKLHALCVLDGMKILTPAHLLGAMSDGHPGVRRHAVRLAEQFVKDNGNIGDALLDRLNDTDAQVRLQLAYSLGQWPDPRAGQALGKMAARHSGDPYMMAAITSSALGHLGPMIDVALKSQATAKTPNAQNAGKGRLKLINDLISMAVAVNDHKAIASVLNSLARKPDKGFDRGAFSAMAQLLDILDQRKSTLADFASKGGEPLTQAAAVTADLFAAARTRALDTAAPLEDRIAAVALLGRGMNHREKDVAGLQGLLSPKHAPRIQQAAVTTIGHLHQAKVVAMLTRNWSRHSPELRRSIIDVLLSRATWTTVLLDGIEKQPRMASSLDASRRQRLLKHESKAIRMRAGQLLSTGSRTKRADLIASYAPVLKARGDSEKGRAIFATLCAVCHRLDDVGNPIGPDLQALTDRSISALMAAILDPNRAVEDKFLMYNAATNDGRIYSGMIKHETGAAVTLIGLDGKTQSLLRRDLKSLVSSGMSQMPEGLEAALTHKKLADLIAYVRSAQAPYKRFENNRPQLIKADKNGVLILPATMARIRGPKIIFEQKYRNLGWWSHVEDSATWSIEVPADGLWNVQLDWACQDSSAGDRFILTAGTAKLSEVVPGTGNWDTYHQRVFGQVRLKAGRLRLIVRSDGPIRNALIDLRTIRLSPAKK